MMEVVEKSEAWEDVGEDIEYSHTTVILRKDDDYFYARTKRRYSSTKEVNLDELELHLIPADNIWPPFSSDLTPAPDPLPPNSYIKSLSLLLCADNHDHRPGDLLLEEARICEILRRDPHPNVAQYLGCTVKGNRVTGLCFVKYNVTLWDRLQNRDSPLDRENCCGAIESGLEHLHSLGLIHNDVNPHNIMLKSDETPVIIDFDSCRREGDNLLKEGTWGWTDGGFEVANRANDYYGLQKIREAMEGVGRWASGSCKF